MAVKVAHALEDCFVAAQNGIIELRQEEIDLLFQGIDLLVHISKCSESDITRWEAEHQSQINKFLERLSERMPGQARLKFEVETSAR